MFGLNDFMRSPVYEPKKRWCGGVYGWVAHRFPVKGGVSFRDLVVRNAVNSMYQDVVPGQRLVDALKRNAERRE
jgi:hypothetical protein